MGEGPRNLISLVYSDPYKKGLGNKARILCTLECVNCFARLSCFDWAVINVGTARQ